MIHLTHILFCIRFIYHLYAQNFSITQKNFIYLWNLKGKVFSPMKLLRSLFMVSCRILWLKVREPLRIFNYCVSNFFYAFAVPETRQVQRFSGGRICSGFENEHKRSPRDSSSVVLFHFVTADTVVHLATLMTLLTKETVIAIMLRTPAMIRLRKRSGTHASWEATTIFIETSWLTFCLCENCKPPRRELK